MSKIGLKRAVQIAEGRPWCLLPNYTHPSFGSHLLAAADARLAATVRRERVRTHFFKKQDPFHSWSVFLYACCFLGIPKILEKKPASLGRSGAPGRRATTNQPGMCHAPWAWREEQICSGLWRLRASRSQLVSVVLWKGFRSLQVSWCFFESLNQ